MTESVSQFLGRSKAFLDEFATHRPDGFPNAMFAQFRSIEDSERWAGECRAWQALLHEHRLAGITWPTEVGGLGLSAEHALAWTDLEFEYEVPRGLYGVTLEMVGPTLLVFGTDEQKAHCARILRGEESWCQLFSEPGAGSDLAAISTSAVKTERGWRANGQKVWTSEARHAQFGYLLARTDPSESRHRGLTAFVVDLAAPGVDVRPLRQMTGGASFSEIFFDDVELPEDAVLGEVGQGWSVAMTTLGFERFTTFSRSLDRLVKYAASVGLNDEAARQRLVDAAVEQRCLSAFESQMNQRLLAGTPPGPEAALAKLATGRLITALGEAVLAGSGARLVLGDPDLEDWRLVLLCGPAFHIAGGTDEIVKTMIAERVLGLPRG